MDGLEPLVQGRVAVLEYGADAYRELLAAVAALLAGRGGSTPSGCFSLGLERTPLRA